MTAKTRLPITCSAYEPSAGSKRCVHYLPNGGCALPDEFMCVEWLKANAHAPAPSPAPPPLERNLLGEPLREAPPARVKDRQARSPEAQRKAPAHVPVVHTICDADLASFKARGLEVKLATDDLGDVWIVPAYTGEDRVEISVEHAALITAISSALSGASVTAIRRRTG